MVEQVVLIYGIVAVVTAFFAAVFIVSTWEYDPNDGRVLLFATISVALVLLAGVLWPLVMIGAVVLILLR